VVAGHQLIRSIGNWGKAESRVGNENSEDAVSWNVFRMLQEAGRLADTVEWLTGIACRSEPELYAWGRRILLDRTDPWPELRALRSRLEPGLRQQTEPDICLRVPGQVAVLIEAKLGSPMAVIRSESRQQNWVARYASVADGVFDTAACLSAAPKDVPEQLLRNILYAHHLARERGEQAIVIALTRALDADPAPLVRALLVKDAPVAILHMTWEKLYWAFGTGSDGLAHLRRYLERKSYRLRPAFDLT
jgi:hypothetical protein